MDLSTRISAGEGGFVLFALTPPRQSTPIERLPAIAAATIDRLSGLDLDGLVLYDIDDESARNPAERPFPFSPTVDPAEYFATYLGSWQGSVVLYRAVGKYGADDLGNWVERQDPRRTLTVMVGASSGGERPALSLTSAQTIRAARNPALVLGGVAIPERHQRRADEQHRLIAKQSAGCDFFVTQVVYDVNAAKDLVSDYRHECDAQGLKPVPIVFTFSVCGSMKTLEFLRWLGVDVPRWIENDLQHSADPLATSLEQAYATATELAAYADRLGVPFGINVESVSIRREEIEASVELARRIIAHLHVERG